MDGFKGFRPTLKRGVSPLFQALPTSLDVRWKSKILDKYELFIEFQSHGDLVDPSFDFPV